MHFSDDDLIAFLLDDAPSDLKQAIEERLVADDDLRERVTNLRQLLGHMDSMAGHFEPPGDLVESSMARIDSLSDAELPNSGEADSNFPLPEDTQRPRLAAPLSSMSRSTTGFMDSIVLCLSLAFLCCLILPSILSARFRARIAQCSANMQHVGDQLLHFAMNDPDQRFPAVNTDPRTGFSGYYVLQLVDSGYDISQQHLQCSSLLGVKQPGTTAQLRDLPSLGQFVNMPLTEIDLLKRHIGGDFAATLGVLERNQIMAPHFDGRATFALLADAPIYVGGDEQFVAHQGRGINIFYEDGRVQFVRLGPANNLNQIGDHPFQNDIGAHAAGMSPDDSSLAPSDIPPYTGEIEGFPLLLRE